MFSQKLLGINSLYFIGTGSIKLKIAAAQLEAYTIWSAPIGEIQQDRSTP